MERVELVEQVILVLAVASLWPFIFGYREPWYAWGFLTFVLATMVVLLVRKARRLNAAMREAKEQLAEGPAPVGPPGSSPGPEA